MSGLQQLKGRRSNNGVSETSSSSIRPVPGKDEPVAVLSTVHEVQRSVQKKDSQDSQNRRLRKTSVSGTGAGDYQRRFSVSDDSRRSSIVSTEHQRRLSILSISENAPRRLSFSKRLTNNYPYGRTMEALDVATLPSYKTKVDQSEPTYRMDPTKKFRAAEVDAISKKVLNVYLKDRKYDPEKSRRVAQQISTEILSDVKRLGYRRYKFVALVNIGSTREKSSINFGSRSLWDDQTDSFSSVTFVNKWGDMWATCTIFGVFCE